MPAQDQIKHVVVLMLENRSFDSVFGTFKHKSDQFEGLTLQETNIYHSPEVGPQVIPVWTMNEMDAATATIPDPDPGESFDDMNMQLFGWGNPRTSAPPPMSGFADNYVRQPGAPNALNVMHYFTEKQVPVITQLARAFGLSDQWHASAPCQTWPNRFFVHTATSAGCTDNGPTDLPFAEPSIFKRLEENGHSWRVYFHDMAQALSLADTWVDIPAHFRLFSEAFAQDVANGDLPNYSFIEPSYFTNGELGLIASDEHPPHNVIYGEQLIATVYNTLRAAPSWPQTLLIITFDEHGGCYDHVPPPPAVPPDGRAGAAGFRFDRYGVRVPAVIVSPFVPAGTIVRPAENAEGNWYPFDHTSIIATLRTLFDLGAPLTARDAAAPNLLGCLTLPEPTNLGPPNIPPTAKEPSRDEVAALEARPPNNMQQSLCRLATVLPDTPENAAFHKAAMASGTPAAITPPLPDVKTAAHYAIDQTQSLFRRP
jgi:phospholipase C